MLRALFYFLQLALVVAAPAGLGGGGAGGGGAGGLRTEPPLTLLRAAQTAQLNGDEAAARKYFAAMLERPETSFLGLRGLLTQALRGGDDAEALRLADRAHRERPKAARGATTLLALHLRAGDWAGAEGTLRRAAKLKAIAPATAQRRRAVLLTERARAAGAAGAGAGAGAGGAPGRGGG